MVDEPNRSTADAADADGTAESGGDVDRRQAAELRDQAGRRRDLAAHERDQAAHERDQAAQQRDLSADRHDDQADDTTTDAADAAAGRARSRGDRDAAAEDRTEAQLDRAAAADDRSAAARDRHAASVDPLTGVYGREAGLLELHRDLARAARTGHSLVVAFVDVDHLKIINDTRGHAAGDQLLIHVAATLAAALRPYDLIVRYGGDEFLCAVQGIDLDAARRRFARVNTMLAATPDPRSVTIGLAQHRPEETVSSLIGRADADLYRQRLHRPH